MRSTRTPMLWSRSAWALLILLTVIPATRARAHDPEDALTRTSVVDHAQSDDGLSMVNATLTLAADALPSPAYLSTFQRYGSHTSALITFAQPTTSLALSYRAQIPGGSAALVDVRGSSDGQHWLPWVTELAPDAIVGFSRPIRYAQYRVTLMSSLKLTPKIDGLSLAATTQAPTVSAEAVNPYAIAPTFRVRATRMGMTGGRTANGWVIPPRARFVSLPSTSVLSSRGGNEYQVRLSYRGRSVVVPVYDVGPYSIRDDYWSPNRRGYPDLPWGWPVDHAAYYQGYNGGRADKGYVHFPTAVDVGDGAWLDDLGIDGDQAELEITFLWMGQDPAQGQPQRDPGASEHVVDELAGDFWSSVPLGSSAVGCGAAYHASSARAVADPAAAAVARWQPLIPVEAEYDLFVHVPVCPSRTAPLAAARYLVQHRDGTTELTINQAEQTGWVHLGRFPFAAGGAGFVQLAALGEGKATVWFDQARWVRVR